MRIENTFVVQTTKPEVMSLFADIPRLAKCVPGCEDIVGITDKKYKAKMVLKLKVFNLKFDVEGVRTKYTPGGHVEAVTTGKPSSIGGAFETKLSADIKELAPKRTQVTYSMEGTMKGKLASIGEMVMKKTLQKNAAEFEDNVRRVFA